MKRPRLVCVFAGVSDPLRKATSPYVTLAEQWDGRNGGTTGCAGRDQRNIAVNKVEG
jgi:hypothetical protein